MKARINSSVGAPLVEIIISLVVFIICGAICMAVFLNSHFTGKYAADITTANFKAASAIEHLHGSESDLTQVLGGRRTFEKGAVVYIVGYDEDWKVVDDEPLYVLKLSVHTTEVAGQQLLTGKVTVERTEKYPFLEKSSTQLAVLPVGVLRMVSP